MGKEDDANSTDRLARSQALLEFYPTTAQTELNLIQWFYSR
ncbi:MAG: hypothetical protein ACJ72X_13755 [Nitrososphaeraceae archaeon]